MLDTLPGIEETAVNKTDNIPVREPIEAEYESKIYIMYVFLLLLLFDSTIYKK